MPLFYLSPSSLYSPAPSGTRKRKAERNNSISSKGFKKNLDKKSATAGGATTDVIAPPPGELFSETNDNSVAILLSYGSARVLLAGDAEAREEEYMANGPYTGPLTVIRG